MQAIYPNHGASRAYRTKTKDIHKVIHRYFGLLQNSLSNQQLALETALIDQYAKPELAQIGRFAGVDELATSELCTQTVVRRTMNALQGSSTKFACEILQVIDS